MYLADYHMHSKYSFDGHEPIENICKKAMERGMKEIAITDHLDIYSDKAYTSMLDIRAISEDILKVREQYHGRLLIRHGVELGQPQINKIEAEKFYQDNNLDFIIGSIHNLEDDFDLYYYDFDSIDCYAMYEHYLTWMIDLAKNYDYDVLGHITYPLRYMVQKSQIYLDLKRYQEQFVELFQTVINRGKGIEVNTSGLFQKMQETMPNLSLIKLYKECGGEIITVGSDCHKLEHVASNIKEGQELLKEVGFRFITTFENRKPIFQSIV